MNKDLHIHYKLWISSSEKTSALGDGKWVLLKTIEECGSLKAASEKCGISYRKAWGDIQKAESFLQAKVLNRTRGGKKGGCSTLTPFGKKLIAAYTDLNNKAEQQLAELFEQFLKKLKTED
jgi:molybdate transport system regulatory protein